MSRPEGSHVQPTVSQRRQKKAAAVSAERDREQEFLVAHQRQLKADFKRRQAERAA